MNASLKGATYGVIAAVSYGMNPLFALPLYDEGLTVDSVLFYRFSLAALLLGVILKIRKQSLAISKREIFPLLLFGMIFSSSSWLFYQSFLYMDAGIACTILFVYPVIVALIMALFFKEHISLLTCGCIALALTGIVLLYKGDGKASLSTIGMVLVMLGALAYSIYIIGVNQSASLRNIPAGKLTFWAMLFGSLLFVVRLNLLTDLQPLVSTKAWVNTLSMAFFPTVISMVCISLAVHLIGSTYTAILGALEPVTALVFGVIVFNEQITPRIILGVILILLSASLIVSAKPLSQKLRTIRVRNRKIGDGRAISR